MRYHSARLIIIIALFVSCQTRQKKVIEVSKPAVPVTPAAPVKKFEGIAFAGKKDLACGMPLTAGLEDTAHYKGEIYGFCSKECKADFVRHAAAYTRSAR